MDLTEGSETSAKLNLTPGKYPKENIQDSEHGENLKSRIYFLCCLPTNIISSTGTFTVLHYDYHGVFKAINDLMLKTLHTMYPLEYVWNIDTCPHKKRQRKRDVILRLVTTANTIFWEIIPYGLVESVTLICGV
jgi:hypothetical protein